MSYKRKKNTKRKREVQRNRTVLILGVLLLIIATITVYAIKSGKETKSQTKKETQVPSQKIEAQKKEQEDKRKKLPLEERKKLAKEAAVGYKHSEDFLWMLDTNDDTIDLVEDYETKKDQKPPEDIGKDFIPGQVPILYQWDERWGYTEYNSTILARSGCGPTALSMVLTYLNNDPSITPVKVAEYSKEMGYTDEEHGTTWELMKEAPTHWGVTIKEGSPTDEEWIKNMLNKGYPIIASLGPGDFTTNGHFIVLTAYEDGYLTVHDPFRSANTNKKWKYTDIYPQMKATWAFTKGN